MKNRSAFARAWSFLDFKPVAKWTALTAAVGTGLVAIALLVVLALFADLMVHRGHIPVYADLPQVQRDGINHEWARIAPDQRGQLLAKWLVDPATAQKLDTDSPVGLTPSQQEAQWRVVVSYLLSRRVNDRAASLYRERTQAATAEPPYVGVLTLVVSTHDHWLANRAVAALARWFPGMWQSPDATEYLSWLLVLALALALLQALLLFAMNYGAAVATIEAATRLRRAIYHHTFRLGTLAVRALGPSEAVSLFTRHVEAVHDMLYAWLTVAIREPVRFALLLIFALLVNFWLALAFLVFALLVWLIGGQVAAYFREKDRGATRSSANQLALLQESVMLMRLVKCYLMERFNQARVERQLTAYSRSLQVSYLGEAVYRPLLAFLALLAAALLLYVTGQMVLDGRLSVSGAIVLVTALIGLYWPLENWLEHLRILRRGRESATTVFQFLDRPSDVGQVVGAEALPPLASLLEFDDVSLREPGTGRMLLRGVSLTVKAGQRVALVGPDEMEKHALVYLIPRFLDPTSGEIRIDQHNLRWVTLDSLRAQIAVVLQHNLVFNDTVTNNVSCGDTAYSLPQVIEAAKVAHAHHFIQKLPQGYDTLIGEMGHSLNIGEMFRIALARAILRDPALLLIEEPPTGLLDEDTYALLDDTFLRMLPGRTTIFLPHRVTTIRSCNQVFLLHKGKIEAAGEHKQLLTQSELYQHLHYLEFNMFAGQL